MFTAISTAYCTASSFLFQLARSAYLRTWKALCLHVLKNMKLSEEEKKYVEVDGPQIVQYCYEADLRSVMGGCPEARNASREANRLADAAQHTLTLAGVSEARQKFLERLLYETHSGYSESFGPRKISNIAYHCKQMWQKGVTKMLLRSLMSA